MRGTGTGISKGLSCPSRVLAPGAVVGISVDRCQPRELVFVASDVDRARGCFFDHNRRMVRTSGDRESGQGLYAHPQPFARRFAAALISRCSSVLAALAIGPPWCDRTTRRVRAPEASVAAVWDSSVEDFWQAAGPVFRNQRLKSWTAGTSGTRGARRTPGLSPRGSNAGLWTCSAPRRHSA